MRRSEIVAAARRWIGTPFHHQARRRGVGADCLGLVCGVADELGVAYQARANYGWPPDPAELMAGLCANLVRRDQEAGPVEAGQVLLVAPFGLAVHCGIATPSGLVHAFAPLRQVVEHERGRAWPGPVFAVFDFPGVEEG